MKNPGDVAQGGALQEEGRLGQITGPSGRHGALAKSETAQQVGIEQAF